MSLKKTFDEYLDINWAWKCTSTNIETSDVDFSVKLEETMAW